MPTIAFQEYGMPAAGFALDRTLMSMGGLESDLEELYRRVKGVKSGFEPLTLPRGSTRAGVRRVGRGARRRW